MNQTVTTLPLPEEINHRRSPRYPLAVPVDIVVLRFGIPATIPGRSVNVSEGGVAAVLAGEVQPGEAVGVEFKLPFVSEAVQARALVKHYGPMSCGMQFLAMTPEQQNALHTWTKVASESNGRVLDDRRIQLSSGALPAEAEDSSDSPSGSGQFVRKRMHGVRDRSPIRNWPWVLLVVLAVVAIAGVWKWVSGWRELEPTPQEATSSVPHPSTKVPGPLMERRVIHKVDPVYPPDAARTKLQGVVILSAIIGADGKVQDLRPVSGPEVLSNAAMDAVKWWRYLPYQTNGTPMPVETTIEVDFRLGD